MNKPLSFKLCILILALGVLIFALWLLGASLAPVVSLAALLDSVNPCAFSVLFLTIAFLLSINASRATVMRIGIAYIVGIFVVYLGIGLGILQVLSFFGVPHFMSKVGASLVLALGVWSLIASAYPESKAHLGIPKKAHRYIAILMEKASVPTALVLGVFVGLCEFPCTGGPYLMILGLLHDASTYYQGLGYLIWYNIIFVSPLALILMIASDEGMLAKVKTWRSTEGGKARIWGSIAMMALGIGLLLI
jgi:cytochrome c biogenesis protein CcdA